MNEIFNVGSFCFRLEYPEALAIPENFLKFRGGNDPEYTYRIRLSGDFPVPEGQVLARREDILVLRTGTWERRYIGVKGNPLPYACYEEMAEDEALILLDPERIQALNIDPMFVSLFALERRQIEKDAMILHCAYLEYKGEAILFTAPSGTGKTTQGNLWERHRGAVTVNGDRALLQRRDGVWAAQGWPVCGTSEVCHNRALPIRAIVTLSQAPGDTAEILRPAQAFTQVFSQITANRWNRQDYLRAMELTEKLIGDIPIYHLACTMAVSAVEALEKAIFG